MRLTLLLTLLLAILNFAKAQVKTNFNNPEPITTQGKFMKNFRSKDPYVIPARDTWQRIDNGQFKAIEAMSFINNNTGYMFINLYKGNIQTTLDAGAAIYKTEDGGDTWQLVDNQILEKYDLPRDAYFLTEDEGYFSSSKKIFHTANGGQTWQGEAHVDDNEIISKLYYIPGGKGIAIGTHGLLLMQK